MAVMPEPGEKPPKPISVNAFADRMGVARYAVRRAIRGGRLDKSVVRDDLGRPKIADPALAEREWAENAGKPSMLGPELTISDHRRRLLVEQTKRVELENKRTAGKLVPQRALEQRYASLVITAKGKIRGVPSRIKQRIPHLTAEELGIVAELLDEALEELADGR